MEDFTDSIELLSSMKTKSSFMNGGGDKES